MDAWDADEYCAHLHVAELTKSSESASEVVAIEKVPEVICG